MAARHAGVDSSAVIQAERKGAVELLQQYTRLKRDALDDDLGWAFLVDSLIFKAGARVRWLDACEARLDMARASGTAVPAAGATTPGAERTATPATANAREEALR